MENSRKTSFLFGISTTIDYTVPIELQLELYSKHNFEFVSFGGNLEHSQILDRQRFETVIQLCNNLGLQVDSFHLPFGLEFDLAHESRDQRSEAVRKINSMILVVSAHGINNLIIHPHNYFNDRELCLKNAIDSLESILGELPDNCLLAIENLPTPDGSWICGKLLDHFDLPKVGFCYDSSHENMSGTPFHLLEKYQSRLITTHLSDNWGQADEHLVPGDGNIDWPNLAAFLKQSGIRHVLFEVGTGKKLLEPIENVLGRIRNFAGEHF